MKNPFQIKEIPVDAPFCNREKEIADLVSYAKSNTNVVLFSPRRYGKTSLVTRVQKCLGDSGTLTAYCDLFGVTSIEEIAGRIAKTIYSMTRNHKSLFQKAINFITSFRPVLSPNPDGGVSVSVQPALKTDGLRILEDTMESLEKFVGNISQTVQIAFDEYQEITEVKNSIGIEGVLRQYIQKIQSSFFFIGSRRRVLLEIFNDRKRPFFQSAINYELKYLPTKDIVHFIIYQFKSAGKDIDESNALQISQLISNHPYYMQKFCFFLFEETETKVSSENIIKTYNIVLDSERIVFESILQGLTTKQITMLVAFAKEPTASVYSASYMSKHHLSSTGSIQQSLDTLSKRDLIEKNQKSGSWFIVDPVFRKWLADLFSST